MKRFKKVLLINPVYNGSNYHAPSLLSGLGYISEALDGAGVDNRIFDMALGYNTADLVSVARLYAPDLFGFFLMTYRYQDHYKLMGVVRAAFPSVPIVVGGPHVSTMREDVLYSCDAISYGVVLEGEETIVELCSGKSPDSIAGLLWRSDCQVRYNGDRPPIEELNRISFPSFAKFEIERYPYYGASKSITPLPIVTSRGCPSRCIYCPVKTAIGNRMRFRTAENVYKEIVARYTQGFRSLWIADDNFTIKRDRVVKLCELLCSSKLQGLRLGCGNGIRADLVDKELLVLMRRAGFWYLAFGIESGSDSVLKRLRKGYKIAEAERGIREACEAGFEVVLFFLIGSPGETERDFRQSLILAERYPVADARFYNLIPYFGTELFEQVSTSKNFLRQPRDYLNDTISWRNHPVFETVEMPKLIRKRLFREGQKVRSRIRRRQMVRKLNKCGVPIVIGRIIAAIMLISVVERQWRESGSVNRLVLWLRNWRKL